MTDENPKRSWSYYRWPVGLALFLLATAAASLWVMTIALQANRDLLEESPYEKGLRHQEVIDQAALLERLGWAAVLSVTGHGREKRLDVSLRDRSGAPIRGARVTAQALRPSSPALDRNLELLPHGDGYSAPIEGMTGFYLVRVFIEYRGMKMRLDRNVSLEEESSAR